MDGPAGERSRQFWPPSTVYETNGAPQRHPAAGPMSAALWSVTDELVDRAPNTRALRAHGLHLLAGARLRALGRPVPEEIVADEWHAALATLAVPALLERARAAYDGQLMVMKGPEVALRYPDPALRAYRDIDLLADDAEAAERALLGAGFQAMGSAEVDDVGYHVCPLVWPGLSLCIEVHRWPHWVEGLELPPVRELLDAAEPSGLGVAGILAPAPHHHALLLAGHAWVHEPLRRLVELIDVAAFMEETDREAVRKLARRWGCNRVWHTTELAVDSLLYGTARSLPLRTWARHLSRARERTVLESRVQRLAGPAWGLPMREVPRAVLGAGAVHVRRHDGERWREKLARTGKLVRNAASPISEQAALNLRQEREPNDPTHAAHG
jgi:hypothetical protein